MNPDYEIAVNESFQLELESNPTTGYAWKWTNQASVSILVTLGLEFEPDQPATAGSGGKEIWKFKGVRSGLETVRLDYCRSWDATSTVASKEFLVKVN